MNFESFIKDKVKKINKKFNCYTNSFLIHNFKNENDLLKNCKGFFDVKSNFCISGEEINASSEILKNFRPNYTCTVIKRAIENGFCCFATTNMDEFAVGVDGTSSYYGKTIRPWMYENENDITFPGGSSSGAGVSATLLSDFSFGTDTGGSSRLPAVSCGIYSFKPTYGCISRFGIIEYGSSLDQVGILSRKISNIKNIFNVVAGKDDLDMQTYKIASYNIFEEKHPTKINIILNKITPSHLNLPDDLYNKFYSYLSNNNYLVDIENDIINVDVMRNMYNVLSSVEFYSNMNKFDAIRFGKFLKDNNIINDFRCDLIGEQAKRKVIQGSYILGYKRHLYEDAAKIRRFLYKKVKNILDKNNFIIFLFFSGKDSVVNGINSDAVLSLANITGLPATTLPIFVHENEPISIMVLGKEYDDINLLNFSEKISKFFEFENLRKKYIKDESWIRDSYTIKN